MVDNSDRDAELIAMRKAVPRLRDGSLWPPFPTWIGELLPDIERLRGQFKRHVSGDKLVAPLSPSAFI
jgi:hypothetical protein